MKKHLTLFALSTIFGAGLALAQDTTAPATPQNQTASPTDHAKRRADPNQQLQRLSKRLNLTADQQNQLLPVLTDRQQQSAAIFNDSSLTVKDRHVKMRALREDSDAKIKAVLNDTQKQQYEQMQQHRRGQRKSNSSNS